MAGSFLRSIDLDALLPTRLWAALGPEARNAAARAFYASAGADDPVLLGVDASIAKLLRFRPDSVRRMPRDKKAGYLARAIHPDENLAAGLLQALHLENRRLMLKSFLDDLGIGNDDGHISAEVKLEPPPAERLEQAVGKLSAAHPAEDVDLYLTTLLMLDPATWSGLRPLLEKRRSSGA